LRLTCAFNLDFSLCCGQVFRWRKIGDWWYGVVGDRVLKVRQYGAELEFENSSEGFVRHYFGLNDDLDEISRCVGKDDYVRAALKQFAGLRIVRQMPWECLVSFICATYKSIAAIELMLRKISQKYGEKRVFDGETFYTFPSVERLASASENGLRECGLGYRARYLLATARKICDEKIDLEALKSLPYSEARKLLLDFQGVGLKVADCVLLFSLGKLEAFPVDVWVKRVVLNHYASLLPADFVEKMQSHKSLSNGEYEKIAVFARSYFGAYAGYAQEYLYHMERTKKPL
jgi:N-glycosylase/DNA lyase